MTGYNQLDSEGAPTQINEALIEETKHWLDGNSEALSLYNAALAKYSHGVFHRNLLDDLRLSPEKLLHQLFANGKSLENQLPLVGQFIKAKGSSSELANMFQKLVDCYTKYNNTYVKHDDAVIEEEIEFVIEITSSFMKHLARLSLKA